VRRLIAVVRRIPVGWRRLRAQPLKAIARGLAALPPRTHRVTGTALVLASTGRGPGAAIRLVGEAVRGRRTEALERAVATAGEPGTGTATRLALARGALAIDEVIVAETVLHQLDPELTGVPGALALRADVAYRRERYAEAAELAGRARRAGVRSPALPAIERRAESVLRVLEPGWRPALAVSRRALRTAPGRVLHLVTNSLPYRQSGYTVRTQSIALAQREAGLDPFVATQAGFPANEGPRGAARLDDVDGISYHRLAPDFDRWRGPASTVERTAREADRLVTRLKPAVLHAASHFQNAQAAFALRERHGLPVVYEVRGFLEESWLTRQGLSDEAPAASDWYQRYRAAETAACLAADAIVTLSGSMREELVARGVPGERIHLVPNAVDVDRFNPQPRDDELAARLGLPDSVPVLGYVSTFARFEGIRYLIEAAALLRDRGQPVRVLLVGDGDERGELEAQARASGLDDGTVLFTGRVPHADVAAYYSLIDVFVVPRTADRVSHLVTPLKPYEAMALERALVVSGVDALREIVTEGETGLVFDPENAISLADTVEPLLDDPEARRRLGRRAREWVTANRTWRQNGVRYYELYRRLGAV